MRTRGANQPRAFHFPVCCGIVLTLLAASAGPARGGPAALRALRSLPAQLRPEQQGGRLGGDGGVLGGCELCGGYVGGGDDTGEVR